MRKLIVLCLLALGALEANGQGRETSKTEFDYLAKGDVLNTTLAGHRLTASNINLDIRFTFTQDRYVQAYELYRDGASAPCAVLLVLTADV